MEMPLEKNDHPAVGGVPEYLREEWAAVAALSTKECQEKLKEAVGLTEANVRRSAALVRRLLEAGQEIATVAPRYVELLRKVAYGQVLPALLVRHMNGGNLLARAAALPLPDQQKIVEDRPIAVMERRDDKIEPRLIPPSQMSPKQIGQVFAANRLRTAAEQITYINEHEARAPRRKRDWVVNTRRRIVTILPGSEALELNVQQLTDMLRELTR